MNALPNITPADGAPYYPSSGAAGREFIIAACDHCCKEGPDDERGCNILAASFIGPVPEWQYQDGKPTCTAFMEEPRLGIDGEPLPEPDPRQMTLEVG